MRDVDTEGKAGRALKEEMCCKETDMMREIELKPEAIFSRPSTCKQYFYM
jgi:hypothetical protein